MKMIQPINDIISIHEKILKLLFTAVFLACGVDLLVNQIPTFLKFDPFILLITSIILIFLSFFYLTILLVINKLRMHLEFEAFFIYNKKKNKLEIIPEYDFSSDQVSYMNAVFAENINLKEFWKTKPLIHDYPMKDNLQKFINELTEYCVLRKLFTHNEDYFNEAGFEDSDIKTIERNDFPELLMKNRFLEIISTPMSERASFNFEEESDDSDGITFSANGENDALFDRFNLNLPKNCILKKPKDNVFIIDSDIVSISFTTNFQGFNTYLPNEFVKRYLKIDNKMNPISEFQIDIIIDTNVKFKSLFFKQDLRYYRWIDNFLQTLVIYLSKDAFFERINWNTAITLIHCREGGPSKDSP